MRKKILINDDWKFIKHDIGIKDVELTTGETITVPHTWNAVDGQDGGNDYYRGACWYVKNIESEACMEQEEVWLEFRGVAMIADVYVNGICLIHHEGGYSTFRADVSAVWGEKNCIAVRVDNGYTRKVYPQKADFTFYGGIYRDVYLLRMPKTHFALNYCGGNGIRLTPEVAEGKKDASVYMEAWTVYAEDGTEVEFSLKGVGSVCAYIKDNYAQASMNVSDVHRWNGKKDPYLYSVQIVLNKGTDKVEEEIGFRSFRVDSQNGFYLNGERYPLCGAARHQDRRGVGNALTREMHKEDMDLFLDMGANTIRLAHYQHDQYFYELCDQTGMIVWTEIPYITEHMQEGRENTITQMKELVVQNYHHPSVICWGLSNEITTTGGVTKELIHNHGILNELCHQLDSTRLTTMANVFFLETGNELIQLPDIRSYNLYYGWYVGEKEENDKWFDKFHKDYPNLAIGLSEYGADALPIYQSTYPQKGDCTETYQALYHEHMLKMWSERPYIWAMHVWNMFDFAADGRDDESEPGVNHKGLVSFDRKLKKDAFYIYKAYLSDEPFLHLCGSRYTERTDITEVKVYSNIGKITLFVDGEKKEAQTNKKVFRFMVPIYGEHEIVAKGGDISDIMRIRKVETSNPAYMKKNEDVVNWFDRDDMQVREGYFSIQDTVLDIKEVPEAAAVFAKIEKVAKGSYGDVANNVNIPESMQKQMDKQSLSRMLQRAGKAVTAEKVVEWNRQLNKIRKL